MSFGKEYFEKNGYISREVQIRKFVLEVIKWASVVNKTDFSNGKEKTALVVGCGCGFGVDILNKLGYDVYGLDISNYAIKYAKQKFSSPEFIVCDIQNGLPFKSGSFNFVMCLEVLEHLQYPKKTLSELYRVGNDTFLCTSPNRRVEKPIKTLFRDLDETHINSKTESDWKTIIEKNLRPSCLRIESFMDSYLAVNNKLLWCKSFILFYFGLSLRIFFRKQ